MVHSPDSDDPAATGESRAEAADEEAPVRPEPELRWTQLREPRQAVEIGANGRILASHYHEGYDAWEVLLETYEGELSDASE